MSLSRIRALRVRARQRRVRAEVVLDDNSRWLMCDADMITARVISRELCRRGCQLEVADDGLAALEIALRPTFVLVSLDLPVLSGWDVAASMSRGIR